MLGYLCTSYHCEHARSKPLLNDRITSGSLDIFFLIFSEQQEEEDEKEEGEDEVFDENIEDIEVTLCDLVNEHFRMDDEDLFAGLGLD